MALLIEILSGVALMLWGLRMVRNGIMSAYGPALKRLARTSENKRFAPFGAGFAAALALQSSTAVAMIAASFAVKQTVSATTAFLIMLGADLGTSLAAVVASQKIEWIAPALVSLGIFGFLKSESSKPRGLFRAIGGVGLVLMSLALISQSAAGITQNPMGLQALTTLLDITILAVIVGVVLTYAAHSSLAIVLIAVSGLSNDLIESAHAVYLVLGANIGSALLPYFANLNARKNARVPVTANLMLRFGAVGAGYLAYPTLLADGLRFGLAEPLIVHLGVNVLAACFGLLFARPIVRLVEEMLTEDETDPVIAPKYLDDADVGNPARALAHAKREAMVMAELAQNMVERSQVMLQSQPVEKDDGLRHLEDGLDRLFAAIKLYVAQVLQEPLSESETRRAMDILSFTANMEHIGDIVDNSLSSIASRKRKLHAQFSESGNQEISGLFETVLESFQLASNTFLTDDRELAKQLYEAKSEIRDLEQQAIASHMDRLGSGVSESVETSSLHIDVVRDLKRINSHLTAVAYPVLLASGEVPKTKWKRLPRKKMVAL